MASLYGVGRPSRQPPPESAGEYRFVNKGTKKIDYLGETNNLKRRIREHERSSKPVSRETHYVEWKKADGRFSVDKRREHERDKINQKNPLLNLRSGGGGRKTRKQRQKQAFLTEGSKPKRNRGILRLILDIILVIATGGLWLIWIFIRFLRNR